MTQTRPVLVVGAPRSGTTWVANTLARGCRVPYIEEPDNHFRLAAAYNAKRVLGRGGMPLVDEDDRSGRLSDFDALWESAAAGAKTRGPSTRAADWLVVRARPARVAEALRADGREPALLRLARRLARPPGGRATGPLVVKSVYAPLAVEWIAARRRCWVIVVLRSPLNVVSSWYALGWLAESEPEPLSTVTPDALERLRRRFDAPPPPSSRLGRTALLIGLLTCWLDEAAARNPGWHRVVHEKISAAPHAGFATLASAAGLQWSSEGDRLLETSNRPGRGYALERVAADLGDAWRSRLSAAQQREAQAVLEALPLPEEFRL
jgi:hypothetical protein